MRYFYKIFFLLPVVLFIVFVFHNTSITAAQGTNSGYQLLADIPTITPTGKDAAGKAAITLVDYMKGLFVATIGLAIVLAVVELVIGGIEYVAAAVPSAKEDAKKRIGGAVGGLLLILVAWILLQALNPKLLNVGLNLEKVAVVGGSGTGGTTTPPPPWCLFNQKTPPEKIGGPFPNETECNKQKPSGLAVDCKLCDGTVPPPPVIGSNEYCQELASTGQARISGGGTVCPNGAGSCHIGNCTASHPEWDSYITASAQKYGVTEQSVRNIIQIESNCNPSATNTGDNGTDNGLMQVTNGPMSPAANIDAGTSILAKNYSTAKSLVGQYGGSVTVGQLVYGLYNGGIGNATASVDCTVATGWAAIPKWGCPINPGTATYNACYIGNLACAKGACF